MAAKEESKADAPEGGKMKLMIIALAAVIVIAGVAVVMFKGKTAKLDGKEAKKEVVGVEMPLGEFTVNLADKNQLRYLKANIVLEVTEEAAKAAKGHGEGEGEGAPAPIRDAVINTLSKQTFDELLSSEGREKLKQQLIEAVNGRLKEGKALDVYFNDFAMQ